MLTELLSRETCAVCRQCCVFESYDIWNTPLFASETRDKAKMLLPDAEFISKGRESWIFRVSLTEQQEVFSCPLLDPEKGCRLEDEKPFECQIWPFRIMELEGRLAIAIASFCDAMTGYSLQTLLTFLKSGTAEKMFAYAEAHSDVIHHYDDLYSVLLWKPQKF